jgi:zinc transport system permease protein
MLYLYLWYYPILNLPLDSLLGIVLPFSMGIGVILLALLPGYQPELISFLFGSILAVGWVDIYVIVGLVVVTFIVVLFLRRELIFVSFDNVYAKITGIKVDRMDIIYSLLLAITIVAGIRFVGIILVNALLVIPASTVRLFAKSLRDMFLVTPVLAAMVVIIGLVLSFFLNIPSGPTIAAISGTIFLLAVLARKVGLA